MRVLLVNMSLDRATGGGTVERVIRLHDEFERMDGVTSRVLTIGRPEGSRESVRFLPLLSRRWHLPVPLIPTIAREVEWADVILLMNHWTALNAIVYLLARWKKRPYVICPAGALRIFGRSKSFKRLYQVLIGRAMLRHAHAAIAIAADESEVFLSHGIPEERICHIPNGIRPEEFRLDAAAARHPIGGKKYILFAGRLNPIKGPDLLLQAFISIAARFPDVHLVFAGPDGGMETELKAMASGAGLRDRVHFVGFVAGEKKASLFHHAVLLVVPSRQEAMSIVALEGAASGIPVVLTKQCGFGELADCGGGLEVDAEAGEIASAIGGLLEQPDRCRQMGERGRVLAMEKYTWSKAALHHLALFRELLQERR